MMRRKKIMTEIPIPKFKINQRVYVVKYMYKNGGYVYEYIYEDRIMSIDIRSYPMADNKSGWKIGYKLFCYTGDFCEGTAQYGILDEGNVENNIPSSVLFFQRKADAILFCEFENERLIDSKIKTMMMSHSDEIERELEKEIGFRRPYNCYDDCIHCGDDDDHFGNYVCAEHNFIIDDPSGYVCKSIKLKEGE